MKIVDPPQGVLPFRENNPERKDLRLAAEEFLAKHPQVYALYLQFGRELLRTGRQFSINLLTERVRYEAFMTWAPDDRGFKINNNHRPYVARKLIEDHPVFAGYLRCRKTRY